MGASSFSDFVRETAELSTARKAFDQVTEDARYEHGHGGYSGTIAEKHEYVRLGTCATLREAEAKADSLMEEDDDRIRDKWGPAGCIEVTEPKGWLFFGFASD